jgi:hypothetical protein
MPDYTGPIGPTKEQWEKWYHRMKDFMNPLQLRQYGVACHPDDEGMIKDMLERLLEDDTWPHAEVPPLVTSNLVKRGEVKPVTLDTLKQVHMSQVMSSSKGFGRFGGLVVPKGRGEGLHDPWKEGASSPSRKKIKPD